MPSAPGRWKGYHPKTRVLAISTQTGDLRHHTFAAGAAAAALADWPTRRAVVDASWSPGRLGDAILATRWTSQLNSTVQWPEHSNSCCSRLNNMPAADARRCAPHERESCHRVCRASLLRPLCSDGMNRSRSRAKSTRARQSKSSLWGILIFQHPVRFQRRVVLATVIALAQQAISHPGTR